MPNVRKLLCENLRNRESSGSGKFFGKISVKRGNRHQVSIMLERSIRQEDV